MILPKDLYEEYMNIINPLIAKNKEIVQENLKLEEIRDNLLPKLMSGDLDVSDLDI
jgi:type I restriction enzyme S subunit